MSLSFDEIASQFDHQRGLPDPAVQTWMDFVDNISGGRSLHIIEPGIGTGRISLPLVAAGHQVTGIDISEPMLEVCRAQSSGLRSSGSLELAKGDATDLPYEDYSFDLGVIAQLLYLVPDWPMVLDELARVVKPGGHVIHMTESTTEHPALQRWSSTWRSMIEATGYRHTTPSPIDNDVRAEFLRRWPDVHEEELSSWHFGQTVGHARRDYGARLRTLYGSVADDAYEQAVRAFLAWAEGEFPDADQTLAVSVTLKVLIASL